MQGILCPDNASKTNSFSEKHLFEAIQKQRNAFNKKLHL